EMDGFEVLRILKTERETLSIPVFALTANAMPREVERGLAAGFARYLTKPLNVVQLLEAVEEELRNAPPIAKPAPPAAPPKQAAQKSRTLFQSSTRKGG